DHLVTQWMSRVISSLGRARNSSHVQRHGPSSSPRIEKSHRSSAVCGVGPAESTGKSAVTYWPGGTRAGSTSAARRPRNPRETVGAILFSFFLSRSSDQVGLVDHATGLPGADADEDAFVQPLEP